MHKKYSLYYTEADKENKSEYAKLVDKGMISVQKFFKVSYSKKISVYVHPNRASLDSSWQKEWSVPDFKSECWTVASGVANKLDLISPKKWDKETCEHKYADKIKTQKLITHELFHVFHGQQNVRPDFSDVYDMDWFVEGLATYASGQFDSTRIREVKNAITIERVPKTLNDFWKGNMKYGLSGSVVQYIDVTYGREKLFSLLKFNKKQQVLDALNATEEALLAEWRKYTMKL